MKINISKEATIESLASTRRRHTIHEISVSTIYNDRKYSKSKFLSKEVNLFEKTKEKINIRIQKDLKKNVVETELQIPDNLEVTNLEKFSKNFFNNWLKDYNLSVTTLIFSDVSYDFEGNDPLVTSLIKKTFEKIRKSDKEKDEIIEMLAVETLASTLEYEIRDEIVEDNFLASALSPDLEKEVVAEIKSNKLEEIQLSFERKVTYQWDRFI